MSENQETAQSSRDAANSIVDAVLDLGTTWAAYGLNLGKTALVEAAHALEASAKTLGDLATRIGASGEVDSPDGPSDQAVTSGADTGK